MFKFLRTVSRDVWLLVMAQGIGMTTLNINIIIVGLAGLAVAPEPWLATLPLSLQFVASMLSTLPASLLMGKIGRRPVFLIGIACIGVGMAGQGLAVVMGSFMGFVASSLLVGIAHGVGQFYRYAAADSVEEDQKSVVISMVLAGGLVAAFLGSAIVRTTIGLVPEVVYAGCFFAGAALQLVAAGFLSQLSIPMPKDTVTSGRALSVFFKMPRFTAGLIAGALGYGVMAFLMTAAPLQIVNVSKLGDSANATVIQWHVVAMFAPSFFTGALIKRFGVEYMIAAGILLYLGAVFVVLNGLTFWHYFLALALVGGGWNALYVGGSSIIAAVATPEERAKVQGASDFIIIFTVAASSLSAGALHFFLGWEALAKLVLIPVAVITLALAIMVVSERRQN